MIADQLVKTERRVGEESPDVVIQSDATEIRLLEEIRQSIEESKGREDLWIQFGKGQPTQLPPSAWRALVRAVMYLSEGNALSLLPYQHRLTSRAAAALLGMSRTYLVRLIEERKINPLELGMTYAGTHRRFELSKVLKYRSHLGKIEEDRLQAIQDIA